LIKFDKNEEWAYIVKRCEFFCNNLCNNWRPILKKASKQLMALSVVAAITFSSLSIDAYASSNKVTSVLPQAGITYALGNNQVSLSNLQQSAR
jgi:hypothetical protein